MRLPESRQSTLAFVFMKQRIQKISIHAGFTCPNRDGRVGTGGCTYCNNQTFVPGYCQPAKTVTQQIEEGIGFFRKKYPGQKYIAYFQSYTNTYAPLERLRALYEEALAFPDVIGLAIGTRPDCVSDELLDYLGSLAENYAITVEYGVESTCDATLRLINRGHDFACAQKAIRNTAARGITVGAHLILGLPQEDREMMLAHAERISELPVHVLKLHQLQLVRGTKMAEQYRTHPEWFRFCSVDEYIELVLDFREKLRPDIQIERYISQSPPELLIAPDWGLKNYEFADKLRKRMRERGRL